METIFGVSIQNCGRDVWYGIVEPQTLNHGDRAIVELLIGDSMQMFLATVLVSVHGDRWFYFGTDYMCVPITEQSRIVGKVIATIEDIECFSRESNGHESGLWVLKSRTDRTFHG